MLGRHHHPHLGIISPVRSMRLRDMPWFPRWWTLGPVLEFIFPTLSRCYGELHIIEKLVQSWISIAFWLWLMYCILALYQAHKLSHLFLSWTYTQLFLLLSCLFYRCEDWGLLLPYSKEPLWKPHPMGVLGFSRYDRRETCFPPFSFTWGFPCIWNPVMIEIVYLEELWPPWKKVPA